MGTKSQQVPTFPLGTYPEESLMDRNPIEEARFSDTGYSYTLSLISGKYKPVIL